MASYEEMNPSHDMEWERPVVDMEKERKQRAREYRVAARREKRNRKADEKKQRKLNATILRRMTRNPDKYNKNAERNRLRAIEMERRKIHQLAVQQAQNLAAIHDPSGASFNVGPVVRLEDGTVITEELLRRREERQLERERAEQIKEAETSQEFAASSHVQDPQDMPPMTDTKLSSGGNGRNQNIVGDSTRFGEQPPQIKKVSKKHQKKLALYEPRPPPPKPVIPEHVSIPEGEEKWLDLWHLSEDQLERRVTREKRRKAADRKALRVKQKSGKAERRAARDERRKVYREFKLEWKTIKEELTRQRTRLRSLEDEESKRIAVEINTAERRSALDFCQSLGFTIENTPGASEIKPKASGMKGIEVDFDAIEKSDKKGDIRLKTPTTNVTSRRVDLAKAAESKKVEYISNVSNTVKVEGDEFIQLDVGEGHDFQTLTYNHKVRRKLRRAIDNAEIMKEMLLRDRMIEHLKERGEEVPPVLLTSSKPLNVRGHRILDNGKVETEKQERVRSRMELTEFNSHMRVLRKQAKEAAIYAGLKLHAELTGKIKGTADDADLDRLGGMKSSLQTGPLASMFIRAHSNDEKHGQLSSEDSASDEAGILLESMDHSPMSETDSDALD